MKGSLPSYAENEKTFFFYYLPHLKNTLISHYFAMFHMIPLIWTQEHNTIIAIVISVQGTEYNS